MPHVTGWSRGSRRLSRREGECLPGRLSASVGVLSRRLRGRASTEQLVEALHLLGTGIAGARPGGARSGGNSGARGRGLRALSDAAAMCEEEGVHVGMLVPRAAVVQALLLLLLSAP